MEISINRRSIHWTVHFSRQVVNVWSFVPYASFTIRFFQSSSRYWIQYALLRLHPTIICVRDEMQIRKALSSTNYTSYWEHSFKSFQSWHRGLGSRDEIRSLQVDRDSTYWYDWKRSAIQNVRSQYQLRKQSEPLIYMFIRYTLSSSQFTLLIQQCNKMFMDVTSNKRWFPINLNDFNKQLAIYRRILPVFVF